MYISYLRLKISSQIKIKFAIKNIEKSTIFKFLFNFDVYFSLRNQNNKFYPKQVENGVGVKKKKKDNEIEFLTIYAKVIN